MPRTISLLGPFPVPLREGELVPLVCEVRIGTEGPFNNLLARDGAAPPRTRANCLNCLSLRASPASRLVSFGDATSIHQT